MADKFGQFNKEHLNKVADGLKMFNDRDFYPCHDELEHWWMEDMGDNARYVYWAIIQLATSLYHLSFDNLKGAEGQLSKAKQKMIFCRDKYVLTENSRHYLSWDELEKIVFSIPDSPKEKDYNNLKAFRFNQFDFEKFRTPEKEDDE